MTNISLTDEQLKETINAVHEHGSNQKASAHLGLNRRTVDNRMQMARERGLLRLTEYEEFPEDTLPPEEIIKQCVARFKQEQKAWQSRKWFEIKSKIDGPYGICWFGDPHLDDNGCNWPLLEEHIKLCRKTEGMFGANIGDSHNNWVGRLGRLYAEQDTSRKTAIKLVEWFFRDSGVDWMVILKGNHDMWSGTGDPLDALASGISPILDWNAQFKIVPPKGRTANIWAAHDFKGHSQWNPLHGPSKKAQMTAAAADLYVCGHKHNWGIFKTEDGDNNRAYTTVRLRGYKYVDSYADVGGFGSQQEGASVVTVFNPYAKTNGQFLNTFEDVEAGSDFLTFLRKKYA